MNTQDEQLFAQALQYHKYPVPGKVCVTSSKPLLTPRDLSLAYTPGVAAPVLAIKKDEAQSYEYTARGNLVAVISNGTAVLGLGNCGAAASKPVMEGKGQLFKKFAGVDVFDLEINCSDPDRFIDIVRSLEPTFGGINLEDIAAPDCFYIEKKLQQVMNIPVFHDDQHGTAVVLGAAFVNAVRLAGKSLTDVKVVFSGAGAAATACMEMLLDLGVSLSNITVCDEYGVIYRGREHIFPHQEKFARATELRTLAEAMRGADCFVGLSVGGIVSQEMVRSMASEPLVLAMANPFPEITYEAAKASRSDVIVGTGRSDYPNQINNVLGFPGIFRGALDARAKCINKNMKIAASLALAQLAREEVPQDIKERFATPNLSFGSDYLLPKPGDPRVPVWVAAAVAEAAVQSGAAQVSLDIEAYRQELRQRFAKDCAKGNDIS
ncbi:MAG: malic enzyme-like NAD(P)-binding protein [bacterium]|nr:malic enzyme-like NAD(P)-binding protein [bacterium]